MGRSVDEWWVLGVPGLGRGCCRRTTREEAAAAQTRRPSPRECQVYGRLPGSQTPGGRDLSPLLPARSGHCVSPPAAHHGGWGAAGGQGPGRCLWPGRRCPRFRAQRPPQRRKRSQAWGRGLRGQGTAVPPRAPIGPRAPAPPHAGHAHLLLKTPSLLLGAALPPPPAETPS